MGLKKSAQKENRRHMSMSKQPLTAAARNAPVKLRYALQLHFWRVPRTVMQNMTHLRTKNRRPGGKKKTNIK